MLCLQLAQGRVVQTWAGGRGGVICDLDCRWGANRLCLLKKRIWTWAIKRSCNRVTNLLKYYPMLGGKENKRHPDALGKRNEVPRRKRDKISLRHYSHCYSFVVSHLQRFSRTLDNILPGLVHGRMMVWSVTFIFHSTKNNLTAIKATNNSSGPRELA